MKTKIHEWSTHTCSQDRIPFTQLKHYQHNMATPIFCV